MASNGLCRRAKNGKCQICHRVRKTDHYVKPVGEVSHGFAIGYIWECIDAEECDKIARKRIEEKHKDARLIEAAINKGRATHYIFRN